MLQEDILASKSRLPELELRVQEPPPQYSLYMYGYNAATGTPFADKRVRQAMALSLDRELYFDAFWNRQKFADEGIPIKTYNSTPVVPVQGGSYWMDPLGKDFGPSAKYFKRDVAEAKKLLSAAGFANGLKNTVIYTPDFGEPHVRQVQMIVGFAQEAGINFEQIALPNVNSDFRPKYIFTNGNFNGLAFTLGFNRGILDPVEMSASEYIPSAAIAFPGYMADGQAWKSGDPAYTTLLNKAREEFDEKKRLALMQDFQRMEAENQYLPSFPGTAEQLVVSWPALRNMNVFRSNLQYNDLWIDETKAPFKKA
jgi:ABC-type transport system substrate-binding protein